MLTPAIVALAALLGIGAVRAEAACTPWPSGIDGCLTLDRGRSKCGEKAAANIYKKLVPAIIKCETRLVKDVLLKGLASTYDEQGCENTARQLFFDKTDNSGCPCVDEVGIANVVETNLNGASNLILCDPLGFPVNGFSNPGAAQMSGRVPSSVDILGCQQKLGKCVSNLVKLWIKCYQKMAKDFTATAGSPTFDVDACVFGPIPGKPGKAVVEQFDKCATKAGVGTTCAGCENLTAIVALAQSQIEGNNDLSFCSSASGAFVE